MGLETATYISSLTATNPIATDNKSQGDDHLRLIKSVLQSTFPNADKAFYFPDFATKSADFTVAGTDLNKTFAVTTAGGEVTATLPALAASDDGWVCHFIKTNTGTNAFFIAPASGTLQSGEVSGLAKCRRVIPGHRCTAMWTGTAWFISRVPNVPIGSCLSFDGATLPVGYEWPNGQTLTSASTKYPEFYSVNGNSGVTVDRRGRVDAGKDDMGGSTAGRITNAVSGFAGTTLGAAGGLENHTLVNAELPALGLVANVTDPGHFHTTAFGTNATPFGGDYNGTDFIGVTPNKNTDTKTTGITVAIPEVGGGGAHRNVQPTIIANKILVVE